MGEKKGRLPRPPVRAPPPFAAFGRCLSLACSPRPARAVGLLSVGHPAGGASPCARSLRLPLLPRASHPRLRFAPLLPRPARLRRSVAMRARSGWVGYRLPHLARTAHRSSPSGTSLSPPCALAPPSRARAPSLRSVRPGAPRRSAAVASCDLRPSRLPFSAGILGLAFSVHSSILLPSMQPRSARLPPACVKHR